MTKDLSDPWAAAAVPSNTSTSTIPQNSGAAPVTDELTGNNAGYDPLFGGEKLIALFNKTHGVGTERGGIITKAPEDRQSRFYKAGGVGALKFWVPKGATWADGKPVTDKNIDPVTGEKLRPCMDTVFVLQTDYRLTAEELAEKEMEEDSGLRGVFASGEELKAIKAAIRDARITARPQMVGMRFTEKRTGKATKGDYEGWTWAAKLEKV